jgi:methyl-accepting chemotaxis protein/methyl-accepting chemotaxis protein-1 (serine sensor receptor)
MSQVDDQFRQSNGALGEMIASMAAMRESAARVSRIIKTIDEIAFQTNLLALNAAVEAARAGEAGTGFAVVAEEVRSLAQRSAQAARDTAGLIEESSERAKAGGHKVEEVAAAIGAVTGSIASVRQLVDEVSTASRQQADGIAQVSQALAQMEKVTQSTAATAEESAAASEELNAQADAARATVRHLAQLVHGGPSTDAPDRPAAPVGPSSGARTRRAVVTAIRQRPRNIPDPEQALPLGNTGTFNAF